LRQPKRAGESGRKSADGHACFFGDHRRAGISEGRSWAVPQVG
jgi:hypothetical protein